MSFGVTIFIALVNQCWLAPLIWIGSIVELKTLQTCTRGSSWLRLLATYILSQSG